METVYLSLGSNMGERAEHIARAVAALSQHGVRVTRQSALYETEPVNVRGDDWFLNCVVEGETTMAPEELMKVLLAIERSLGRRRAGRPDGKKEPRTIDIDILLFGSSVVDDTDLKIPHPRIAERKFVLVPFAEIAGDAQHPLFGKTIATLLNETRDSSAVRKL